MTKILIMAYIFLSIIACSNSRDSLDEGNNGQYGKAPTGSEVQVSAPPPIPKGKQGVEEKRLPAVSEEDQAQAGLGNGGGNTPVDGGGGGDTPVDGGGGGNTPVDGGGGGDTPVDGGGGGDTPVDGGGGGDTPVDDGGGGDTPVDDGGGDTPVDDGGGDTPVDDGGGGDTPVDDGGSGGSTETTPEESPTPASTPTEEPKVCSATSATLSLTETTTVNLANVKSSNIRKKNKLHNVSKYRNFLKVDSYKFKDFVLPIRLRDGKYSFEFINLPHTSSEVRLSWLPMKIFNFLVVETKGESSFEDKNNFDFDDKPIIAAELFTNKNGKKVRIGLQVLDLRDY